MKFVLSVSYNPLEQLPQLARAAEDSGWDMMAFADHVVQPQTLKMPCPFSQDGSTPWNAFTDWPDLWVVIASLAAVTSKLEFASCVYVLPLRNPFVVAKAVSTAAVMSGDRVALGVGIGWSKDEFELLGQEFHNRGKRCDEMIEILRRLWGGGWVEFHGQYYDFDHLEMSPAPNKSIPIWVGGVSDAALRRAARFGDGWVGDLATADTILEQVTKLQQLREEYARIHLPFSIIASPSGSPAVDQLKRLEEAGVTHIRTRPWQSVGSDLEQVRRELGVRGVSGDLQTKLDAVCRYSDEIIRPFRS